MENPEEKEQKSIKEYLMRLGINEESARLYLALVKHGPMSIFQASRAARIERTKLYRSMDTLFKIGLIEEMIEYKRRFLKAASINSIRHLVEQRKTDAAILDSSFSQFSQTVQTLSGAFTNTEVLYFRGQDGIRQMLWNQLQAKKEVACYTYRVIEEVVGVKFWRQWVDEFERRKLLLREIRTEIFYKSLKESKTRTIMSTNQIRFISSKVLPINLEVDIYNDVYTMFDWHDGEVFGVEIHNQKIADMQMSFYEVFWKMAVADKKALALLRHPKGRRFSLP